MKTIQFTIKTLAMVCVLASALALPASALEGWESAQNYDNRRNQELNAQRVPLETVIAQLQSRCGGRLVNARHDNGSNQYIIRWETDRNQIVSIRADSGSGRIVSGGC